MANGNEHGEGLFRRLFRDVSMPDDDWQKDTRRQFLSAQRTMLAAALDRLGPEESERRKAIVERIEALLRSNEGLSTWRDAFEAEQLICFLQTGSLVDEDIRNRLAEADSKRLPGTADRVIRHAEMAGRSPPADDAEKQALLFALVCDLQRLAQKNYQIRQLRLGAVHFVMIVAFIAILVTAVPLLIYVVHARGGFDHEQWPATFVASFPNYGLFSAVSFGILGALFSRFIVLQSSEVGVPIDEATAYYSRRYILLRVFIGTVAAIIVYFFVGSGLIEGSVVPDIRQLTSSSSPPASTPEPFLTWLGTESKVFVPGKNFALLVIWSFLAGFSEQLVPNLLNNTAGRIASASKAASGQK